MKQDVIDVLKRDNQQKSNEIVKTKQDLESALNKTIEEYEGRLKTLKLEFEAKLNEATKSKPHQVSTKCSYITSAGSKQKVNDRCDCCCHIDHQIVWLLIHSLYYRKYQK